jgi:hypothetical protein
MATILEMPLEHPSRKRNPFRLRTPNTWGMQCPFGCDEGFGDYKELYAHLIDRHPEKAQQARPVQ